MLCKRVIVCLDVKDGRVVKGVRFRGLRDAGDPGALAARYEAEGADEIVLLDISASVEGRRTLLDVVRSTAEQLFIPLTVGGGMRDVDDIARALRAGADKVAINTAAVRRPALLGEAAARFGEQCVVASIDAALAARPADAAPPDMRRRPGSPMADAKAGAKGEGTSKREAKATGEPGANGECGVGRPIPIPILSAPQAPTYRVHTHGGRAPTELDAVAWARECAARGAGEILLTSIDRDGCRTGFDLVLTRAVADAVAVPVIASGGAGAPDHFLDALTAGGADAALAAGIFHDGTTPVDAVKRVLAAAGLPVRAAEESVR